MSVFDDSDIERVRNAVDIAEVIGGYVTLKRRGAGDLWGRCPFHSEKTASFHVRSDRGMFHCFGCGKGGNAFTFIMEMERLTFAEAVRLLADRAGITLRERRDSAASERARSETDRLTAVNAFAARWFHSHLTGANLTAEAARARDYLAGRGVTGDIVKRFQIGWAKSGWDGLVSDANKAGLSGEILTQAGLAYKRKDGTGHIDKFRARIIFPIHSLSGKVVAFGGRRIDGITPEDDVAKYINTPETTIYQKGEHLYGLYVARETIRKEDAAYLVEGYIDLLALVQAGILNSVASLGTALTEAQARLLSRFCSRAAIVYDADDAGVSAALRAADILTIAGIEVLLAKLPAGEDPDSLLRKQGKETLVDALHKTVSFVEFRLNATGVSRSSSQNALLTAARSVLHTIGLIRDPLRRDLLLNELAQKSGLRRDAIDKALKDKSSIGISDLDEPVVRRPTLNFQSDQTLERDLLRNLLAHPELVHLALNDLTSEYIEHPILRELFIDIEQNYLRGVRIDPAALASRYSDPVVVEFITAAALDPTATGVEAAAEAIRGCVQKLILRPLKRLRADLELQIAEAQRMGESTQGLVRELVAIQKRIRGLG